MAQIYRKRKKVKIKLLFDKLYWLPVFFFLCKSHFGNVFLFLEKKIMGRIVQFFYNKDIKIRIYDVI